MTTSTAKESLKIKNAKKETIKAKDKWTDDLTADQVDDVNQSIASICQTQYKSIVQTANELCKIRNTIEEGNWLAFCNSGEVPLSSRTIMDYVRANNWLALTEVKKIDSNILGSMSPRSLSMIAGVANAASKYSDEVDGKPVELKQEQLDEMEEAEATLLRIEDRLKRGKLTQEQISKEVGTSRTGKGRKESPKKVELLSKIEQLEQDKALMEETLDELKTDNEEMAAKLAKLEREVFTYQQLAERGR
ncbi:hypothetical protein [Prochlorococcus marinus]|uniref:Uncharacterized protein n=1 Tax=Prochlorococcus marinus (strain MIT 9303) TaxID=59922 RepID=A2C848_PROM3|nr:hypothetical protein [Prochlorococcus marinus]ABM77658.1 Hypothetical protein P9303_09071 [Prochlorococcus marinus str. MIT 9303]